MTVIFLTEYNTTCYGVIFQNNGWTKVQKFEDISDDENNIYCLKRLETCLGKSEVCDMTLMSGAFDKDVFDGNTILLKISEQYGRHSFVYIGGNMICSFLTNDNIYRYISNIGNNLTPYSIAIGEENISFLTPYFEFNKRQKIDDNELLKTNKSNVDQFKYHVSNCGKYSFKKLATNKNQSNYDNKVLI